MPARPLRVSHAFHSPLMAPVQERLAEIAAGITARINALGMRGDEVEHTKPEGVVRIAAVGDSFTFGEGVRDEDTLPSCLRRQLAEALPELRVEVLNFGVSGYSTRDEVLVVRERVLSFAPDLILLIYALNDPELHPDHLLHRVFHRPAAWERSHLLRLLAHFARARAVARHPTYEHYLHDPAEGHWSSVQEGFRALRDATAAAGVPVLVCLMPMLRGGAFRDYPALESHERVAEEARASEFEVLDLLGPMRDSGHPATALRNAQDAHLNPLGNRLAAEEIFRCLSERYPRQLAR